MTWQEQPGTSGAADKGSLEIKSDTLVYFVDAPSDLFEFEIVNFTPVKCGHAADKPYRLGAASGDERDMWVSAPLNNSLKSQKLLILHPRRRVELCVLGISRPKLNRFLGAASSNIPATKSTVTVEQRP